MAFYGVRLEEPFLVFMGVSAWIFTILKGLASGFGFGASIWLIRTSRRLLRGVLILE